MNHVNYIDRIRAYYLGQGYRKPYRWARFDEVPFTPLSKPLSQSRATLVSTGEVAIKGDPTTEQDPVAQGRVRAVYSVPADTPPERLHSRTHSYDRHATHLDDVNAYFPVTRLHEAARAGRLGGVTPRLHGVYNEYSHRKTVERDAPEVLARCRADGADVALVVPV